MGPDGGSSTGKVPLRASDSDRVRTTEVIKAAFFEGRLDHDEYAERIRQVRRSRTDSELAALVVDLPAGTLAVPRGAALSAALPAALSSFDVPAAVMCVTSVALAAFFLRDVSISPLTFLAAMILAGTASARAQLAPTWERIAIWGISGLTAVVMVGFVAAIFL